MNYGIIVSAIFVPACVSLLFHIIRSLMQKASLKKVTEDKFTVYIPNLYATIGVITATVFGAFILFSPIIWPDENSRFMIIFYIVFGAFFWLGIFLIIKTIRFRIVVERNKITVYPLFSKTYMFTFGDVNTVVRQRKKQYKGQAERIIIRTKQGKKIVAENSFVMYFNLLDKIQEVIDQSKLIGFD